MDEKGFSIGSTLNELFGRRIFIDFFLLGGVGCSVVVFVVAVFRHGFYVHFLFFIVRGGVRRTGGGEEGQREKRLIFNFFARDLSRGEGGNVGSLLPYTGR